MPNLVNEIAGKIMNEMEKLLLERVYIAILKSGDILYSSTAMDKHIELLKLFSITEFKEMALFDHSFLLAGTNLAIFKLTDEILVALYTKKGYQGQLLSFKSKMSKYINDLKILAKKPTIKPVETESMGKILPKLVKTVSLTLGLSEDEAAVLKLCDGSHSIAEILVKTRFPRQKVIDIIRQYENKDWLELETRGEFKTIPISIKKFPETALQLGIISKKSYEINKLCNGNNTFKDIANKLNISEKDLKKTIEKMEKNKIIKMTVKIPEEVSSIPEFSIEDAGVLASKGFAYPELNIKPLLTANVSFSLGFKEEEKRILSLLNGSHSISDLYNVTQIPHIEIFKVIIRYEAKGWIRIPINDFMHFVTIKEKLKSEYEVMELKKKYQRIIKEELIVSAPVSETIVDEISDLEENKLREYLLKRIQEELPLMPPAAQNKIIEKLIKNPAHSRKAILNQLFNSESSKKFKKIKKTEVPKPYKTVSTQTIPPSFSQTKPKQKFVIDESPLLRPSELFNKDSSLKKVSKTKTEPLLTPKPLETNSQLDSIKQKIVNLGDNMREVQPELYSTVENLRRKLSAGQDQINEVLDFIDSLLGIPEILYLALIDFNGTIFYQTTKETELWDITKDVLRMIQNWKSQAPSIFIAGIKFATIKAAEMLIATNVGGFGHIMAIPINEKLFIFIKVSRHGDILLISNDVAIVAKQINEMF